MSISNTASLPESVLQENKIDRYENLWIHGQFLKVFNHTFINHKLHIR